MISCLLMTMLNLVVSSILVRTVISPEQSSNAAAAVVVDVDVDADRKHRSLALLMRSTNLGNLLETIFQTEGLQMNTRKMKNPLSMFRTPMMLKTT